MESRWASTHHDTIFNPRQLDVDAGGLRVGGDGKWPCRATRPTTTTNNVRRGRYSSSFPTTWRPSMRMARRLSDERRPQQGRRVAARRSALSTSPPAPAIRDGHPLDVNLTTPRRATVTQFTGAALRFPKTVSRLQTGDDLTSMAFSPRRHADRPAERLPRSQSDSDCCSPTIRAPPLNTASGHRARPEQGRRLLRRHRRQRPPRRPCAPAGRERLPGGGATTGSGKVALTDPITGLPAGTGSFSLWATRTRRASRQGARSTTPRRTERSTVCRSPG